MDAYKLGAFGNLLLPPPSLSLSIFLGRDGGEEDDAVQRVETNTCDLPLDKCAAAVTWWNIALRRPGFFLREKNP